jgi:LPXTG-site transpeptidase (sortase) family protein
MSIKKEESFFTKKDKILARILTVIFVFFVVVVNFNQVLKIPVFIRSVPEIIHYKISSIKDSVKEEEEGEDEDEEEDENNYCDENQVTINAISAQAPVVESYGSYGSDYKEALNRGVVHFSYSAYPGEEGLSILLGHSAPPGWPDIRYDRIFTEIDELKEGDVIEICYNNKSYDYIVIDEEIGKEIYEVGEDVVSLFHEENKKELVVMTCWPPGSTEGRIGIRAVVND